MTFLASFNSSLNSLLQLSLVQSKHVTKKNIIILRQLLLNSKHWLRAVIAALCFIPYWGTLTNNGQSFLIGRLRKRVRIYAIRLTANFYCIWSTELLWRNQGQTWTQFGESQWNCGVEYSEPGGVGQDPSYCVVCTQTPTWRGLMWCF